MATIVNTPPAADNGTQGTGFLIGAIILLLAVFMFFYYGLPAIRNAATVGTPSVSVPEQIDVNVNGSGAQPPAAPAE